MILQRRREWPNIWKKARIEGFVCLFVCLMYLFIYFWLLWVFVAPRRLSLVAASGGYSLLQCAGLSLQWPLMLLSTGSRHVGFSSCGMRAQQLWLTGLVAPRHVGSSRARDRTRIPCIGRLTPNHCATRKAQNWGFNVIPLLLSSFFVPSASLPFSSLETA